MVNRVFAWLVASLVGYILFAAASQTAVLNMLMSIGAPMPLMTRLASTGHAIVHLWALLPVVMLGFAIAFLVAGLVKKGLKPLAPVAYPIAGAVAIITALELMWRQFEVYPILGAQQTYGYVLCVIAGAIGGLVFDLLRGKKGGS